MEFWDVLIFLSTLLIFINGVSCLKMGTRKLPPGPAGVPIIGNLLQVGDRPHESLAAMAKSHGSLMTIRLGFITTIVASSADSAREVLQKNDKAFTGRPVPDAVTAEPNNELSLLWQSVGPCWRNLRKLCNTQIFTTQRLDALQGLRNQKIEELVRQVSEISSSGVAVNVSRLAFATTLNLVSNTIFSADLVDPRAEGTQEFKDMVWKVMEYAGKPNLSDFFPFMRPLDVQGVRRGIKASYNRLHGMVDEMIEERLKSRASGCARRNDFLDVLLDSIQENGSELDRGHVKVLIGDLFIAGGDTTATTTEWAIAELLRNPDKMAKVQKEVMDVVGLGRMVQESDIPKLPYLQAALKESMRLHPTAPLLPFRQSEEEVELGWYVIPKNTQVLVNTWAISRDPSYWENPTCFLPERFLNSEADFRGRDYGFLPFGGGRRICPGLPLATRMVHLMIASLLHAFDWRLPKGTTPESMNMSDKFGITLQMAVPLRAFPSKRLL